MYESRAPTSSTVATWLAALQPTIPANRPHEKALEYRNAVEKYKDRLERPNTSKNQRAFMATRFVAANAVEEGKEAKRDIVTEIQQAKSDIITETKEAY